LQLIFFAFLPKAVNKNGDESGRSSGFVRDLVDLPIRSGGQWLEELPVVSR
jgi:hypothetical protein